MSKSVCSISLVILLLLSVPLFSQVGSNGEPPQPTTRILFVFDASQSMYGRWQSDIKIKIARELLSNILDSLVNIENLEMALRVYGHQKNYPPQDCNDTRLEVGFGANNAIKIKHILSTLTPKGTTPIAYSLQQAEKDFTPCENCRNIIVLITDGIEECGGDPCAVSRQLQKSGIALKPFIIGIGRNFSDAFDCVGTYYDASSEVAFRQALNVVISQALNSTTAQVNLLDTYGKPTETNVNMTFYDSFSGLIKYNFIHTLNNKGLPDTITIDPLITYNVVVHTLPSVKANNIKLTPGKHTVIPVYSPQGYIQLKVGSSGKTVKDLRCIVREDGKMKTLNIQTFGNTKKYLTGQYDLEILCLPRILVEDVEVSQSHTTTVEIPQPGIIVIQKSVNGYGSLYVEENNELRWIYDMRDDYLRESLLLQPGNYRVVFRSKYMNESIYTIEKSFHIESGITTNLKLYEH